MDVEGKPFLQGYVIDITLQTFTERQECDEIFGVPCGIAVARTGYVFRGEQGPWGRAQSYWHVLSPVI